MSAFTWPKGLGDEPKPQEWEDGKSKRQLDDETAPEASEQGTASRLKADKK